MVQVAAGNLQVATHGSDGGGAGATQGTATALLSDSKRHQAVTVTAVTTSTMGSMYGTVCSAEHATHTTHHSHL